MKRGLITLGLLLMAATLSATAARASEYWAPLGYVAPLPPLGKKQGWLTITNRSNRSFSVIYDKDTINVYEGENHNILVLRPGQTHTVVIGRDTYDLYGNNPDKLKVKIREGRTTTMSLEPYGGSVMAVINDGDKVRSGVLFTSYAVVVPAPRPPTVIIERPAPPPVIVSRPPPPRPGYHHGGHRPPPPPRPPHGRPHGGRDRDGSWGMVFGIGKR